MPTLSEIKAFSKTIDDIAYDKNMKYMEAVVWYCETNGLEMDIAASLLSATIKAHIAEEAEAINLMKKTARLPI